MEVTKWWSKADMMERPRSYNGALYLVGCKREAHDLGRPWRQKLRTTATTHSTKGRYVERHSTVLLTTLLIIYFPQNIKVVALHRWVAQAKDWRQLPSLPG